MASVRGLVVSPPITVSANGFRLEQARLDPQELRFALLFWDKLDFPENNLIGIGLDPDAEFLVHAGVLKRTRVVLYGSWGADCYRHAHVQAFTQLDEAEPGVWSLATGERSISFVDHDLEAGRGALVNLHRALPVPDKDVHLQDVLDFKQKRHPELAALRHHLEGIYVSVGNAVDGDLAFNSEYEALDRAIADYIKSTRGLGLKWRLAGMEASLNLAGAIAGGYAAYKGGLSATEIALGAGAGALAVKVGGLGLARTRGSATTPFRYVSSYYRDLFPPG